MSRRISIMTMPVQRPAHSRIEDPAAVGPAVRWLLGAAILAAGLGLTGCQVDVGGQTLPSAYYLQDDIQYFPAGPEFKLAKEAAAQKAYRKEMAKSDHGPGMSR
jgi:hypothetical protein